MPNSDHKSNAIRRLDPISVCYPDPNDANATRYLTFVRAETVDGTVGWGEAITQLPEATRATHALIEGLADLVVGGNPLHTATIWRMLINHGWWYGYRGGIASFAISAIDVALWDLKGKILGLPLVSMLGGPYRTALPAVASTHVFDASLEVEAERHGRYVQDVGYRGVKVGMGKRGETHLGYEVARDVEFVRLLRDAVGPDAWIMMDRGQSLEWDVAGCIERVRSFEQYGLKWIEEPFEPTDIRAFQALREHTSCLVAGGEREWDARGAREALAPGVLDVFGCDVGRVGGITGALGILGAIQDAGVWFNSHAWSSAINTAAAVALSASTPSCLLQELKPDPSPMQDELVTTPVRPENGEVQVPLTPGLGIEVDEHTVARYSLEPR